MTSPEPEEASITHLYIVNHIIKVAHNTTSNRIYTPQLHYYYNRIFTACQVVFSSVKNSSVEDFTESQNASMLCGMLVLSSRYIRNAANTQVQDTLGAKKESALRGLGGQDQSWDGACAPWHEVCSHWISCSHILPAAAGKIRRTLSPFRKIVRPA